MVDVTSNLISLADLHKLVKFKTCFRQESLVIAYVLKSGNEAQCPTPSQFISEMPEINRLFQASIYLSILPYPILSPSQPP